MHAYFWDVQCWPNRAGKQLQGAFFGMIQRYFNGTDDV